jgi:hypothetical protein
MHNFSDSNTHKYKSPTHYKTKRNKTEANITNETPMLEGNYIYEIRKAIIIKNLTKFFRVIHHKLNQHINYC